MHHGNAHAAPLLMESKMEKEVGCGCTDSESADVCKIKGDKFQEAVDTVATPLVT